MEHQGLLAANPKRRMIKLEESDRIYRDNMHLLRKLRDIDYKKERQGAQTFHLKSLNSKNRSDSDSRIYNENLQLIGRLQSQKSRYDRRDILSRSFQRKRMGSSKQKTESSLLNMDYASSQYERLATAPDGYSHRLLLYTELVTLNKQLHHLEISQADAMYYVLLHNLTYDRCYKLRLVEPTGEHLISLIRKNQIRFSDRIHQRNGVYVLRIPFHPFVRSYTFWVLQKQQHIRPNELLGSQHEDRDEDAVLQR